MNSITVRDQVFEVIVRQAMAGAPWREICAGPMRVNNITEQEVDEEVERRLNLFSNSLSESQRAMLEEQLQKWTERLTPPGKFPILASLQTSDSYTSGPLMELIERFYAANDLTPPTEVVFCRSPLTFEFYLQCSRMPSPPSLNEYVELATRMAEHADGEQEEWLENVLNDAEANHRACVSRNTGGQLNQRLYEQGFKIMNKKLSQALDSTLGKNFGYALDYKVPLRLQPVFAPLRAAMNMTSNTIAIRYGPLPPRDQLEAVFTPGFPWMDISGSWGLDKLVNFGFLCDSLYEQCRIPDLLRKQVTAWMDLYKAVPWNSCFENVCFVGCMPSKTMLDERRRISSFSGPAIVFPDGAKFWAVDGIAAPRKLVESPGSLTADEIERQNNVALRRLMMDVYGHSRFLMDTNAVLIHEDEYGQLYRKDLGNDEPLVMVRVTNKTMEADGSHVNYFLRVPPTITTARQAVAWTFQREENEYHPAVET